MIAHASKPNAQTRIIAPICEADLSPVIAKWLAAQGYEVWHEVAYPPYKFRVDMIGERRGHVVVVQLKLACTQEAIIQAQISKMLADQNYIAISTRPHSESIEKCRLANLGVLIADPELDRVIVALEAPEIPTIGRRPDFIEYLHSQPKGKVAGMPNVRDERAEAVAAAVKAFIGERAVPDWRTIFESVTNHYANPREMKAAIWPRIKPKRGI
jgi:hypothetical protein